MSFIKESYLAYKKVQEVLEKETSDHEISMARSELEGIADKATATSSMLEGMTESGNPLPAWVQSKITNASDYITSVHDYLKYNPQINESVSLEETTFEKIYQMQQDGKSVEDIAKELNLKADLVKKVLGESKVISEGLSDAQIAQLKKEYEPLKGKTITTSQYQQLKNILFKLQDGDLEKLQKQNIPFASTGAGSILRVRKSPVKITNVTVPGLEGMAEEKIPQDYLDYLRTIVLKNVDFYEVPPKQIIQSWRDEKNKDRFKGKMVDYKEAVDMSKVTKYKMISIKGDQKEITIDREDLEKHLKLGYVIKEPLTEESDKGYNVKYKMKKDDASISMSWYKDKELAQKFLDDVKKSGGNGIITAKEEVELDENISQVTTKKSGTDTDIFYKGKHIGYFHKITSQHGEGKIGNYFVYHDNEDDPEDFTQSDEASSESQAKKIAYDSAKFNGLIEEVEITETHFSMGQHVIYKPKSMTPRKAQIVQVTEPQVGAYYKIKISPTLMTYAKPDELELEEACWTGYKQVGLKKKGKRMVPNCVPEERRLYIESIVAVKNKAEKSGMPYSVLKQVYDRGMAAWKGGHRPGTTQVQWALARVNSFVTKSSGTWGGADSDLAKKVKG